MCFVDNETFTSTYSDLQHYDTEFLTIYADAHTHTKRFRTDFCCEYFQLIEATGRELKDHGLAINQNDFENG